MFYKRDNFCGFLFTFLGPSEKEYTLKVFVFRVEPFSEGTKSWTSYLLESTSIPLIFQEESKSRFKYILIHAA